MDLFTATFWFALLKIIWVDILLSGDNAVVIALAARNLPAKQQRQAVFFGSGAAIVLRVVLILFAISLMQLPWLKLVGAALLLWIGVQLLAGEDDDGNDLQAGASLWAAVRTILLADFAMSLDNVIAVAAAANTAPEPMRLPLLVFGLCLTIPLIIFGSTLLLKVMERYPAIITLGAALLGFVAGEMAVTDTVWGTWFDTNMHDLDYAVGASCAVFVVIVGTWVQRRRHAPAT